MEKVKNITVKVKQVHYPKGLDCFRSELFSSLIDFLPLLVVDSIDF